MFWYFRGLGALLLCIVFLTSCQASEDTNLLSPTRRELIEHDFYGYGIPNEILEIYGWQERIQLLSWNRHCSSVEYSEQYNPIHISYEDQSMKTGLTISLDPWNIPWDPSEKTTPLNLNSSWFINGTAEFYYRGSNPLIRIEDKFGTPVYISSNLSVSETLQIASQLQYFGPNPDEFVPWKCK